MDEDKLKIGIVVIGYNRLDCLSRLLNRLNECIYPSKNIPLVISLDNCGDDKVLNFATGFEWFHGEKTVIHQERRMGLRKHILRCGEYMDQFGWDAQVVLEDDVYTSSAFYSFALQAVKKYRNDNEIAGIALYSMPHNQTVRLPFAPAASKYDVYFMQLAQSLGQVWMRDSWHEFAAWYRENSAPFTECTGVPYNVCRWPESSWLKYHIRYCVEKNKYFVYPYVSLTTCFQDKGTHAQEKSNVLQTLLQTAAKDEYALPSLNDGRKYDAWCESLELNESLGLSDVCIDTYGAKGNYAGNRYWLTTLSKPYKIIKSFAMELRPVDMNILCNLPGNELFVYDTHEAGQAPAVVDRDVSAWNYYNIILYPDEAIKKVAKPMFDNIRRQRISLIWHPIRLCKKIIARMK